MVDAEPEQEQARPQKPIKQIESSRDIFQIVQSDEAIGNALIFGSCSTGKFTEFAMKHFA